jgi:formylglycine-generating enzyme required for sulfatase activity
MDSTNSGGAQGNADDHLGYSVYAQTLWERIQAALNRDLNRPDKSLGEDPLVVGIFGEWGSGKSFLLRQVMDKAKSEANRRITEHKSNDTAPLTVPVFFQPWKYEHEKHLLVPLLLHIQSDLQSALQRAMPDYSRNRQWLEKSVNTLAKHIGQVVDVFGLLMDAALKAFQIAQPQTMLLMPVAKTLASWLPWNRAKTALPTMAQFRFDDTGGRSYYEMHAILKAITRPSSDSVKKYLPQTRVDQSFSVNFVIFIDDLDRCLPEKSVEVLELIKTVFNLESFAFVLALDDEVVERGIGHRYKDYALLNKKPEMPITGFEYLEKIVHLPLRLPPLTSAQAIAFLPRYEASVLLDRASRLPEVERADWVARRTWFAPRDVLAEGTAPGATRQIFHLGQLVVSSFDACAPRKLVRVVELWHQVLDVLEARERAGLISDLRVGGAIDPRLLMTTVLLQLFQPELFRSLRRSRVGLNVLLDGFRVTSENTSPLSAAMSDMDLLHWAVYRTGEKPPVEWKDALHFLPNLDAGQRGAAQRQRLPLVERLLEHRSVQRHSFDPLKLLAAVYRSSAGTGGVALPADTFPYFSVMGAARALSASDTGEGPPLLTLEGVETPAVVVEAVGSLAGIQLVPAEGTATTAPAPTPDKALLRPDQPHRLLIDPAAVFQALVSPEEAEQRHVAEMAGLGPDVPWLHPDSSRALRDMIEREFLSARIKGENVHFVAERRGRVLRGLMHLAPHIPHEESSAWWALVEDAPHQPAPFHSLEQLQTQARWMNVRAALGIDNDPETGRFDSEFFCLPRERFPGHGNDEEPVPGFVWVQKQRPELQLDQSGQVALAPFLMARYLTTVDQFRAFVDSTGYQNPQWWDSQGWAWVTGSWDTDKETPDWLRERLSVRPVFERRHPALWAKQQPWRSRPVWGVNWFEARAYARWLNGQGLLRDRMRSAGLGNARVELPIEAQWERAASASSLGYPPDQSQRVLRGVKGPVELFANVHHSGLSEVSPVGLFPASALGLSDINGNVWEWQDNLREDKPPYLRGQRIPLLTSSSAQPSQTSDWLVMDKDPMTSASPGLRGGPSEGTAEVARDSFRNWLLPDNWDSFVGFRLVLSMAE